MRYRDAGVDLEAADASVRGIKDLVRSTFGPHVVTDLGAFAGLATIPGGDPDTLLVTSMDGVGTKLKIAAALGRYDTVGQDLVNHCVGDIGVHGAEPLLFLDYVGMGKLDPAVVTEVVKGLAIACRENGCALIGGETAEMPGVYTPPDFDLVGCIVGTMRREDFVDGSTLAPGDVFLGFPSTGLHTNGYSLARRVLLDEGGPGLDATVPGTDTRVGDALLAVHRSYRPVFRALRGIMKGAAHITGGGMRGNLSRVLPPGVAATVDVGAWTVPPLFRFIGETGNVPADDLYDTFNMGIGLVVGVAPDRVQDALAAADEGVVIGEAIAGDGGVTLRGLP
jgi:phosphoribosylformylglycinamidine cyclo-ligase